LKTSNGSDTRKIVKSSRPIGKGRNDIVAIKLNVRSKTITKIGIKSNIIHLEDLASAPSSGVAEWQHPARQQEMISDGLRNLRDQGLFAVGNTGIIIPSHLAPSARSIYPS